MTIRNLYKNILPFVKPYKHLIFLALGLTVIGSFAAQINAFVLKYTVDKISDLLVNKTPLKQGMHIIGIISAILLGKEIIYSLVQFGQKFYGEKLKIMIAREITNAY
jgi:ABC-type multidrug transport system fused ATPase/permease subunit